MRRRIRLDSATFCTSGSNPLESIRSAAAVVGLLLNTSLRANPIPIPAGREKAITPDEDTSA
jgi:hypothetical protein